MEHGRLSHSRWSVAPCFRTPPREVIKTQVTGPNSIFIQSASPGGRNQVYAFLICSQVVLRLLRV